MNKKTIGLLVGVTLLLLAVVGIGYGLWFEVLEVEGTVETGDVDVFVSPFYIYEWFDVLVEGSDPFIAAAPYPELCDNANPVEGCFRPYAMANLPVGPDDELHSDLFELKSGTVECTAELLYNGDLPVNVSDSGNNNTLRINVTGAHPSYHCRVIFDITSNGSVPVHLGEWIASERNTAAWVSEPTCEPFGRQLAFYFDPTPNDDNPGPEATDNDPDQTDIIQLHHFGRAVCYVDIHFDNDTLDANEEIVQENGEYTFDFLMEVKQWNESGVDTGLGLGQTDN